MAISNPTTEIPDISVEIEQEIKSTFDRLIGRIIARRDVLLEELRKLMIDFQEKIKSQNTTLIDLENFRTHLQSMEGKENVTSDFIQLSLAPIEKQISDLKIYLIQPPNLQFSLQASLVEEMVGNLGKIVCENKTIDYSSKLKATHLIDIESVSSLHIDGTHLYVASEGNITKYDTTNWALQGSYEFKESSISGIATTKNHCYVTSRISNSSYNNYYITKLTKDKFQLIKQQFVTGGYNSKKCEFTSIAIPSEDEIFVVDKANNRICVFDSDLFFRWDFGTSILKAPSCIKIQENKVIIRVSLYSSCSFSDVDELHLFNKQGDYIGILTKYGEFSNFCDFCFDSSDNMIYSYNDSVIIISPNTEVIHTIGGSEDLTGCDHIAVYKDTIVVACSTLRCIKIF